MQHVWSGLLPFDSVFRICCVRRCPTRWSPLWEETSAACWTPCGWWTSCWCCCLRDERRCPNPPQGRQVASPACDVWTVQGRDRTDSSSTVSAARTPTLWSTPSTPEVRTQTLLRLDYLLDTTDAVELKSLVDGFMLFFFLFSFWQIIFLCPVRYEAVITGCVSCSRLL